MDRSAIIKELESNSIRKSAINLSTSYSNLRYWIKIHGINIKRDSENPYCRKCGDNNIDNFYKYDVDSGKLSLSCKKCNTESTIKRYQENKIAAINLFGGKCISCGYNKYAGALEFHHINPLDKDPNWEKIRSRKPHLIMNELGKCALLCKNCHAEIHAEMIIQTKEKK